MTDMIRSCLDDCKSSNVAKEDCIHVRSHNLQKWRKDKCDKFLQPSIRWKGLSTVLDHPAKTKKRIAGLSSNYILRKRLFLSD